MKNKINIMLTVVGVLTVGVFFTNVVASNFLDNNNRKAVASNENSIVQLNDVSIEKLNIEADTVSNEVIDGYVEGDVQVIEFDLNSYSFPNLTVKANQPVKLVINADENSLNSCNYMIISQDLGFQKELQLGENIIELAPIEAGNYIYSCWMGMIGANIYVVDEDVTPNATFGENVSIGGCCSR